MNINDHMVGERYGSLTVTHRAGVVRNGTRVTPAWRCVCDCGAIRVVAGTELRRGRIINCKKVSPRHKFKSEYVIYHAMKSRCYSESNSEYQNYGGRGIRVCDRWLDGEGCLTGIDCFLADIGPRPTKTHSLERRDVDGHYEPSNVKWATAAEQAVNKRNTPRVIYNGELMTVKALTSRLNLNHQLVVRRLWSGFSLEQAVSLPKMTGKRRNQDGSIREAGRER